MGKYLSLDAFTIEKRMEALSIIWDVIYDARKVAHEKIGPNDRMYYDILAIIEEPCDKIQNILDALYNNDFDFSD